MPIIAQRESIYTILFATHLRLMGAMRCGHLVTQRMVLHKPRCRANGVHSVREERSTSAAAHHLLGVARPIHHREQHHYSSPLTIPHHHHSFAPCLSLSHPFRAFSLGPTLPWILHLVPRLKSIIKTWNANERF